MDTTNNQLFKALQLQEEDRLDDAAEIFRSILRDDPANTAALYSLGLLTLKHYKDSTTALKLAEAGILAAPLYAPMHALRATILHELGDLEAALASYKKATELDPNYITGLINSSVLQQQLSLHAEALVSLKKVLDLQPEHTLALANYGTILTEFKRNEEAIAVFSKLINVAPNYDFALGMLAFEKRHICDWEDERELAQKIINGIRAGQRTCKTFPLMALCDEPQVLHIAARLFTEHAFPPAPNTLWQGEKYNHKKIRIGYVSADFREHPVGHLMAGVIEKHDKEKFETIAISLGSDDGSKLRERFIKAFDQFHDVRELGGLKIAQLMKKLEIDIAVNLSGYTSGSRNEIFSYRPSPIQVNYLGYPGTLGADYIDYILADRHVTPFSEQNYYSEKIVQLPNSYLPTDGTLQVSLSTPSRAQCGLPDDGFVFCSFNHDYKISPEIFSIWMRLLQRIDGSVLWLMKLNDPAQKNLQKEAKKHGISPDRLIFATRVPHVEDHLARYRLADLFLDCYPYNAHTTAADALFVGLPVLTYMGNAFQGRVAGSLLTTLEIPELITYSLESYEDEAYRLATDKNLLSSLRKKISLKRESTPLYNTELFCKHVELAYKKMWERWQDNQLPSPFMVINTNNLNTAQNISEYKNLQSEHKLHLGKDIKNSDFETIDALAIESNKLIDELKNIPSNHFAKIYAPNLATRFDYREELQALINEWFRLLQPSGLLYLSVPNFDYLCELIINKDRLSLEERFMVMRTIFGGHMNNLDYNKVGLNMEFLSAFLSAAGFAEIKQVSHIELSDDPNGIIFSENPINLNIIAKKPDTN